MKLSVVILNFNVEYFLQQCLLSVEAAIKDFSAEIIVVDNNSADGSCAMVRRQFPNVKLIENSENLGFPKGNNIGVSVANGEYICILNPDTVVAEDTFSKILQYAESLKNPGIIGCRLIDGTGKFLPESKRGIPTPFVALTKIVGLYKLSPKLFGKYYASHLSSNKSGKVEVLVGAFMILKRHLYQNLQGFDEDCFMYSDDIDLSYRALQAGYENYYFAGTTVIHYKGESTIRDQLYMTRFKDAMNYFYTKHFKISPVFNFFMKSGAAIFALSKSKKTVAYSRPHHFLLVSSNTDLRSKVENLLGKNVRQVETAAQIDLNSLNPLTQIILDNAEIQFKNIIDVMQNLQKFKVTFRILPSTDERKRFLIGSDNSNDRGEIIVFE